MYYTILFRWMVQREQRILPNIEKLEQRYDAIIILLRVVGFEVGHGHFKVE